MRFRVIRMRGGNPSTNDRDTLPDLDCSSWVPGGMSMELMRMYSLERAKKERETTRTRMKEKETGGNVEERKKGDDWSYLMKSI